MTTAHTIPELVRALGGWKAVAEWAGYEDTRGVHNWVKRGVPQYYHLRLVLAARRKGVEVDPKILRLNEDEEKVFKAVMAK